jgi:hypothetical protein
MRPETKYARSDYLGIAYRVFGEGETDLVVAVDGRRLPAAFEGPTRARA